LHCQNANTLDSPGPSAQPSSQGFEGADLGPRASLGSLSFIAHQHFEGWAKSFSLGSLRWLLRASLGNLSIITHRVEGVWILGPRASLGHPSIIAHQQLEGWAESFSLGSPSFAHRQFYRRHIEKNRGS